MDRKADFLFLLQTVLLLRVISHRITPERAEYIAALALKLPAEHFSSPFALETQVNDFLNAHP